MRINNKVQKRLDSMKNAIPTRGDLRVQIAINLDGCCFEDGKTEYFRCFVGIFQPQPLFLNDSIMQDVQKTIFAHTYTHYFVVSWQGAEIPPELHIDSHKVISIIANQFHNPKHSFSAMFLALLFPKAGEHARRCIVLGTHTENVTAAQGVDIKRPTEQFLSALKLSCSELKIAPRPYEKDPRRRPKKPSQPKSKKPRNAQATNRLS